MFIALCGAFRDLIGCKRRSWMLQGNGRCIGAASRWCLEVENSFAQCVTFAGVVRVLEEQKNL